MNSTTILFLILYFLIVSGVGIWAMRGGAGQNLEGFLLGGRRVGPLITALTLQSTSMSGYMFLGAGALGFGEGYWALWYAAGDIGGGVLNLSIIGRRMRKFSELMGALTSIEYLEKRYPSPAIRLIGAALTIFLLGAYVLAQFIAGGKGMALVTGMPYAAALFIAVSIIMLYTLLGGYLAVAYTDFFQSVIMLIGMVWIATAALAEVGGLTAANQAIGALDPTLLSVWGRDLAFEGRWGIAIGAVMVFSIGCMGWPHLVTRHMAMARPITARRAGGYATLFNLFFVSTPYLVGILAIIILPKLGDPELVIFKVAEKLLPPAITGLVMAAIMAAIMSTADSLLLQTGSVASRDIYQRFVNRHASEQQMVWVSRGLVLAIGMVGYLIALLEPPTVFAIVVFTTSVLGSAFLPAYVCAVWWRKANTPGAITSMVSGASIATAWELAALWDPTGLHPMLAGIVGSTAAMIIVSLATQRIAPVPDYIVATMDAAARLEPSSATGTSTA
ncbi:MAG: sodium/proline symporter [Gammaproteobacteria bacterium]|nr:sodium/proline symporter [Gammaproteobacteria bacterium]